MHERLLEVPDVIRGLPLSGFGPEEELTGIVLSARDGHVVIRLSDGRGLTIETGEGSNVRVAIGAAPIYGEKHHVKVGDNGDGLDRKER